MASGSKKALEFDDVEDFLAGKAGFSMPEETVSEDILALSSAKAQSMPAPAKKNK